MRGMDKTDKTVEVDSGNLIVGSGIFSHHGMCCNEEGR